MSIREALSPNAPTRAELRLKLGEVLGERADRRRIQRAFGQ
jgi:hypothetical protein